VSNKEVKRLTKQNEARPCVLILLQSMYMHMLNQQPFPTLLELDFVTTSFSCYFIVVSVHVFICSFALIMPQDLFHRLFCDTKS